MAPHWILIVQIVVHGVPHHEVRGGKFYTGPRCQEYAVEHNLWNKGAGCFREDIWNTPAPTPAHPDKP